jgi:hypothetical protein
MKYYKNVFRPIAPPVDMSILQNTYNTLEQGHLKGVELASKLRSEIAQLPLNESEQGYKDELASGIEQVITENSFNENAYYAIPDLVKAQGDIMSNPVLLNKIQAQADYKAFQDSIEANKEMPGDMKEYYKELNPYKSGQQEDGSYDTSFKWTPNASPKMIVSLADMVTKGISRAAREKGANAVTRWLDENGNITTDPSKAYDGEVYNTTSGTWERLTREKILAGIQSVIAETPGAAESLKQDYDVAIWKLGKQAKNDANGNPIVPVSDVTDPNGIPLTESEYLMKRIEPAIAAAQYYNNISSTTYGRGLATYNEGKAKERATSLARDSAIDNVLKGSTRGMILSVPTNPAGDAMNNMNTASAHIQNLYKQVFNKDVSINTYDDLVKAVDELSSNLPINEQLRVRNLLNMYKSGKETIDVYTKDMTDEEKKNFDWANRIYNNGILINGASKHDDKILNLIKDKFDSNGNFVMNVPHRVINKFREYINNPYDYGLTIFDDHISINKANINYIPQILSKLDEAYATYETSGFNLGKEIIDKSFRSISFDEDKRIARRVRKEYDKANDILDKYNKKYIINPQDINPAIMTLPGGTWSGNYLNSEYDLGLIDAQTLKNRKDEWDDYMKGVFETGADLTQYQVWERDKKDNKGYIVSSPNDRMTIGRKIKAAAHDKRIAYQPAFAPAASDPLHNELGGYFVTIFKDDSGKEVEGEYYIPVIGGESAREMIMTNPRTIATNEVSVMTETNVPKYVSVSEENPSLGNIKITPVVSIPGNERYNIQIFGSELIAERDETITLIEDIEMYKKIKAYHLLGGEQNERQESSLRKICEDISAITGYDIFDIADLLGTDIEQ